MGGTVNRFIPNPTFDPIIVPGCMDPLFPRPDPRGGRPPLSLIESSRSRAEYQDRDKRIEAMDEQGLGAALYVPPPSAAESRKGCATTSGRPWPRSPRSNRWLEEDWGFDYEHRIIAAALLSLADVDAARGRGGLAVGARECASCTSGRPRCRVPMARAVRSGHKMHDPGLGPAGRDGGPGRLPPRGTAGTTASWRPAGAPSAGGSRGSATPTS